MGAGQADVSQTRSSSLRTRGTPSELCSSTAREPCVIAWHLCLLGSQYVPQWRAASRSRGDRHLLGIRPPLVPPLAAQARPRQRQGPYGGWVILASPALWVRQGLRPPRGLPRRPGTLVARLAATCGAKPPDGRHGHVATALDDRGHTGAGTPGLPVCRPTP